jgi:pimeloyl-ACP methyl ester carboxylesterase
MQRILTGSAVTLAIAIAVLGVTSGAAHAGGVATVAESDTGFVEANGVTLFYERSGPVDGEVILLIAGANAQLTMWPDALVAELVARGYQVIRFDNRDMGRSTHLNALGPPDWEAIFAALGTGESPAVPYTVTDLASDAVGLLDALGIEQAHIVGASMGGHVAQRIAIHHPERTRSLTSIASDTGNPAMPGPTDAVLALPPPPPAGNPIETIIERELLVRQALASPAYPTDEAQLRAEIARDIARSYDPAGFERQAAAILAEGDRREALRQLTVPTVVVHGDADPLVPVANGYDTAATIPGADLRIIPGLGHDFPAPLIATFTDAITSAAARANPKGS